MVIESKNFYVFPDSYVSDEVRYAGFVYFQGVGGVGNKAYMVNFY